jgi:hypothetical protein
MLRKNNMPFHEKSALSMLVVHVIVYGWYVQKVFLADFSGPALDVDYRGLMLAMIIFYVVLAIIAHILIFAVAPDEVDDTADERDKLIALRGHAYAGWVMTVFVFAALFHALFNGDIFWISQALLASLVFAEIASDLTKIYFYRRGI